MARRSWTLLILLGSIWGASYLLIKIGLRDLSPAMVAWLRVTLAAMLVLPIAARMGALAGLRPQLPALAALAAVQVAGPFLLISAGETEIDSGLAGILVATTPLFTALLAIRLDQAERATGVRLVGISLGLLGIVALLGIDLGGSGAELVGGLMVVLASLGYAVGGFAAKRHTQAGRPIGVLAGVLALSAVLLLPAALITAPSQVPGAGPLAAVAALGLVGTGLAFVIFYHLYATVGTARTVLVTYIAPGFAVVYGVVLLGEPFGAATAAGLILVLAGSWLAAGGRRGMPPGSGTVAAEGQIPAR